MSGLKQRAQQNTGAAAATGGAASAEEIGIEITETNFEDEVLVRSNQVPVVVLLWSPRSEACVQLADILAGLAAADSGKWSLATVNVETAPRVAQIFGVERIPTVVALASTKELGVNPDVVNVNGGAIAVGHPIGMSGARIVLHVALELARRGSGYGVAALCGAGGQGDALILRAG